LANDLVLTSDELGRVYALARETGQEVWHFDAPGGINAPLVAAGDDLLVSVGLGDQGMVIGMRLNASGTSLPQGGTSASGNAGAAGGGSAGEPTWSAVYRDVLQGSGCSGGPACHASTIAGQLQLSTQAGAYAALVSVQAMGAGAGNMRCSDTGLLRVAPRDPDASLLVQKLEAPTPVCGQHMPPGSMLRPELLQQLRQWILAGAKND
jgi:outer membrane protein assembly factor BamB